MEDSRYDHALCAAWAIVRLFAHTDPLTLAKITFLVLEAMRRADSGAPPDFSPAAIFTMWESIHALHRIESREPGPA